MLIVLLTFLIWFIGLCIGFYFLWKNRKEAFFIHRSPILIVLTQIFAFVSSFLVAVSLLVTNDFCIILNCIYSLTLPVCILPLYMKVPNVILKSDLNEMMITNIRHGWKWRVKKLFTTPIKLLIILIASSVQLGIYFGVQQNIAIPGDCQLYSIFPFVITQGFYLLPIAVLAVHLRKINDPHKIRLEIIITLIGILPGVISLFLFVGRVLFFPFQYAFIYSAVAIFVTGLIIPLIILGIRSKRPEYDSQEDIPTLLRQQSFTEYCATKWVSENILFYQAVEDYHQFPTLEKAQGIYNEYIARDADMEVNLDDWVVERIKVNLERFEANLFEDAIRAVKMLLVQDVIPGWKRQL